MARIHTTMQKSLNDHSNDGVGTHLEPDILECEVKWALAKLTTIKASGGDEISLELIRILKDGVVKVLHLMYLQIYKNSPVAIGLENVSVHFNSKEGQCERMFKLL